MIHGASQIATPLSKVIYASIKSGSFPKAWKEARVTLILKKCSSQDKTNTLQGFPKIKQVISLTKHLAKENPLNKYFQIF